MRGVFLDTVGILAIWDSDDQWYRVAVQSWSKVIEQELPLFATTFVIAECANAASRRPYRSAVERLRLTLTAECSLIFPTSEEWEAACAAYAAAPPGAAGLVDELSIAVMRRLGLQRAFTNDAHFRAVGFETLF